MEEMDNENSNSSLNDIFPKDEPFDQDMESIPSVAAARSNEIITPTPSNDESTRQEDDEFIRPDNEKEPLELDRSSNVNYVENTGEDISISKDFSSNPVIPPKREKLICPVDSTLWMSELLENWDQYFISKSFEKFGFKPKNIKIISDKVKVNIIILVYFLNI